MKLKSTLYSRDKVTDDVVDSNRSPTFSAMYIHFDGIFLTEDNVLKKT